MAPPRFVPVAAAVAAVSGLLVASGWLAPPGRTRAAAPASCAVLQAENLSAHSGSLVRLTLPSGQRRVIAETGPSLNALAYSARQGVTYGIADRDHAVRIDPAGRITDLGRRPGAWVVGAVGAAMAGDSWYLLRGNDLYTVDVDPSSPGFLAVTGRVQLRPVVLSGWVGDVAYDPASGLLYGVSRGLVVTINPRDGRVAPVPGPRFPFARTYGSVVFGPDGALYATADRIGHRSVTYRLPRDGAGPAVEVSTGPALRTADAASCLAAAPPPSSSDPTPSPAPSPSSVKPPPSAVIPPPQSVIVPPPSVTPSPSTTAPSTALPSSEEPVSRPVSASPAHYRPPPTVEPVSGKREHVTEQRRWGLTVLLLVVGGGAAAAHVRRGR